MNPSTERLTVHLAIGRRTHKRNVRHQYSSHLPTQILQCLIFVQDQIGIAFLRGLFAFARCFGLRKGGQFDCVRLRASGRVTGGEEGVDGTAGSRAEEGTDGPWFGGGADEEALGWCHFRFYGFPLSFHGSFNRSSRRSPVWIEIG
jgi:hypothetical protein